MDGYSPLSHALLGGRQAGGPAQPPRPPVGGMGGGPLEMVQRTTGQAQGAENMQEKVDNIQTAGANANQSYQQWMQGLVKENFLPSMQTMNQAMQRYQQAMAPTEYSGMDTAMLGLASIGTKPEFMRPGMLGAALGQAGFTAAGLKQTFDKQEQDKAKAVLDEAQQNFKGWMDEAKTINAAANKSQSLAKTIDPSATAYARDQLKLEAAKLTPDQAVKRYRELYLSHARASLASIALQLDDATYNELLRRFEDRSANLPLPTEVSGMFGGVGSKPAGIDFSPEQGKPAVRIPSDVLSSLDPKTVELVQSLIYKYNQTGDETTKRQILALTGQAEVGGAAPAKTIGEIAAGKTGLEETEKLKAQLGLKPKIEEATTEAKRGVELKTEAPIQAEHAKGKALGEASSQAQVALVGTADSLDADKKTIKELLEHPGFSSAVGATWRPGFRFIPGTDEADFVSIHDQLKAKGFLKGYEILKGGGAITEIEGKKATDAINRMSLSTSEAGYRKAAQDYLDAVASGIKKLEDKAKLAPSGGVRKVAFNTRTGVWE